MMMMTTHQKKVMKDVYSSCDHEEKVVNNMSSSHVCSDMIYMSRRGLIEISESVLNTTHVKVSIEFSSLVFYTASFSHLLRVFPLMCVL